MARPTPPVLYGAYLSGVDRTYALGGVQALAAMAFGLLGERPVDMLVGAGNAYVAEAKRQLFGRVAIDLLAGPSEVAVIADDTVDAELRQLLTLKTRDIAGPAWRDYGSVTLAADRDVAIELMDGLAREHLEIVTADDEYYYARLKNYGWVFIGEWSTVAYSDKGMGGSNHVLPTRGGAQLAIGGPGPMANDRSKR